MKVLILINEDTDWRSGYQEGNRLIKAYEADYKDLMIGDGYDEDVTVPDDLLAVEDMFRIFNIAHPKDYRNRSLSIGDVVVLDDKAYSCQTVGFRLLPKVPEYR